MSEMEERAEFESIFKEARDGNVDYALDELQKVIDKLRKTYKLREALQLLLTTSTILLKKNIVDEAANLANLALKISIGQSNEITLPLLNEFASSYPIENQSISMIDFYLTLIKLSGDPNHFLRKKLLSFAESNLKQRPDFIQKMYLKLYKECFQTNTTSQIIKTYTEKSKIEAKEELKQILLHDAIPLHFSRFLWSISDNIFDNSSNDDNNNNITFVESSTKTWRHTINAIFLRAILIISLQSGSKEKSSLAARTLYESILLAKPDNIEEIVLDHPFYRFSNLITKLMVNYKSTTVDSFKNIIDAYEKYLFQDSEIAILLSLISQKYFNRK